MKAVDASVTARSASPATPSPAGSGPAIRDAATVILVSDRPDLHVLMLERTGRAVFGPGATVFPGGAVDPADGASRLLSRVIDLDDVTASAEHGLAEGGLGLRIAAIRECFEEAGILLAREAAGGAPVDHTSELAAARDQLNAGTLGLLDLLETRGLVLAARELRLFSHWLTPLGAPRRYNTWFFVAPAPHGVDGAHDDNELVASGWVRPHDALAQFAAGEIDLIFPTEMSLRALTRYECVADLFDDLDAVTRDAQGRSRVVPDGTGERVALPADADRSTGYWTIPLPDISFRAERAVAAGEVNA
jgi:8-oxo-dGTP pyrophosphatase MutT (NUDIX family)